MPGCEIAGARTGLDVIELSDAHCRSQLNALGCYTVISSILSGRCREMWQNLSERKRSWQAASSFEDQCEKIAIDAKHVARLSALSSLTSGPMVDVCEYLREDLDRAHNLPAP